jgi:hypothetical protein
MNIEEELFGKRKGSARERGIIQDLGDECDLSTLYTCMKIS